MLLSKVVKRLRRREVANDQGAVLISVIAVSAIVMTVTVLIATSSITATTYSSVTRANLESRAAAEAGIDTVWASMENSSFLCQKVTTSGLKFSVAIAYYDAAGAALTCTGTSSLSGTPGAAVITSTGYAANKGIAGATSGNQRTVIAFVNIVVNNNKATLDKVFFSDGSYTITNSTTVSDAAGLSSANLYSNNNVDCTTTVGIQGSVTTQGNFAAHNKCVISGSVWAGGSVTSDDQLSVSGDVLSAGGTAATPLPVSLDKAWVGGSVVANGNITAQGTTNSQYCSIAGYSAKVCGSVVSIQGSISLDNTANIVGNALALNDVDLGTTNSNLIIGGNVMSVQGALKAKNTGNSGFRVGGAIMVKGTSQLPIARIGKQVSSCASSTTGFTACPASTLVRPLNGLPAKLNFPTNTVVVPPPRESLARINSDSVSLNNWGWNVETIGCSAVKGRIQSGWTGKLLLNVTGCTVPYAWDNDTFALTGDLALFIPAGIDAKNDLTFNSNSATLTRTLHLIVPSDAKLADGTTNLVTWAYPIATDPDYSTPTCAAGTYGDIRSSKITTTRVNTFIYTPCDFYVANQLINFKGQIYSGNSTYPNNSSITYIPIDVPGAIKSTAVVGPPVVVTQTSRFDARG